MLVGIVPVQSGNYADNNWRKKVESLQPLQGQLQHSQLADTRQELLGPELSGDVSEASA